MDAGRVTCSFLLTLLVAIAQIGASDETTKPLSDAKRVNLHLPSCNFSIAREQDHFVVIKRANTRHPRPGDDVVMVLNGSGAPVFERAPGLDIPGVWLVNVHDATLRTVGRLVVAANVRSGPEGDSRLPLQPSDHDAAVLLEYDLASRTMVYLVRTSPILCNSVSGTQDGTLWCLGVDVPMANARQLDYDLVYRFDGRGKVLGSSLSRSEYPSNMEPLTSVNGSVAAFLPSEDGLWLWLPAVRQLIAFEQDGRVHERLNLPALPGARTAIEEFAVGPGRTILALSSTVVRNGDARTVRRSLGLLAAAGNGWIPVEGAPTELPPSSRLLGADSDGLILLDTAAKTVLWMPMSWPATRGSLSRSSP